MVVLEIGLRPLWVSQAESYHYCFILYVFDIVQNLTLRIYSQSEYSNTKLLELSKPRQDRLTNAECHQIVSIGFR